MIDTFKKLFSRADDPRATEGGAGRHRIAVATCALLLEMAAVDGEFSGEEQDVILHALTSTHGVGADEARSIMEAALAELEGSIDLWQFARIINKEYSVEEKVQTIEAVWRVIYADGRLDGHEDHLVHRLADLLRLSHSQLIEAKLRVKNS